MAIGEINKELKQQIDDIKMYIDYLWEHGRGEEVPEYERRQDSLSKQIDTIIEVVDSEFVTNRQWDSYATRIMNKNLKLNGHSLTQSGICRRANDFILDIRSDQGGMLVKTGWREAMRKKS